MNLQKDVYNSLTPARNASNKNSRGIRWGILMNQDTQWSQKYKYQLSAKLNPEEGGRVREIDLLPDEFVNTDVIDQLIKDTFNIYHGSWNKTFYQPYLVQLTAISYQPTISETANPPPPEPHQDGYNNGIIVLRRSPNIIGGVSRVYSLDLEPLYELELGVGDGIFIQDDAYFHQVTPMMLDTHNMPSDKVARDILIVRIDEADRKSHHE